MRKGGAVVVFCKIAIKTRTKPVININKSSIELSKINDI
jgi:hypothetical protein